MQREEREWGVLLTLQPLSARPEMKILAEVNEPRGDKKPEIRVWFDGVPRDRPLRITELNVWNQQMRQLVDQIKDAAAELANPKRRRKK